jgi:hypothetical protein
MQVTRDRGVRERGAVAQEGEVHCYVCYVDGGLCSDARCDEIQAKAGVYVKRAVARWRVKGGRVRWLRRLGVAPVRWRCVANMCAARSSVRQALLSRMFREEGFDCSSVSVAAVT